MDAEKTISRLKRDLDNVSRSSNLQDNEIKTCEEDLKKWMNLYQDIEQNHKKLIEDFSDYKDTKEKELRIKQSSENDMKNKINFLAEQNEKLISENDYYFNELNRMRPEYEAALCELEKLQENKNTQDVWTNELNKKDHASREKIGELTREIEVFKRKLEQKLSECEVLSEENQRMNANISQLQNTVKVKMALEERMKKDHAIEVSSKEVTHQEYLEKVQTQFRECLSDKDHKLVGLSQQLSDHSLKSSAKIKELNSQIQNLISKMHNKDNSMTDNANAQAQRGDMLEAELNDMRLTMEEMRLTIVNLDKEKVEAVSTIDKNAIL